MKDRINISSGARWEDVVGYSRAVRIGNVIEVAGTTAVDASTSLSTSSEKIIGEGNAYEQTIYILNKIKKAIEDAGGKLEGVIRTRIFTTDISKWEEIGKAHGEFFSKIKPVTTMVEVKALIDPRMLVEIEATAVKK